MKMRPTPTSAAGRRGHLLLSLTTAVALWLSGCGRGGGGSNTATLTIQNIGSDTMVNLAQAWAEAYAVAHPEVSIEVSGGGSGIGIAALINQTADIANASRRLEPEELARAKKVGEHPQGFVVGYDALSIFVHPDNPLVELSLEELGEIYREGGRFTRWSDLGVKIPGLSDDRIVRVSRQNNSGTYHYFREAVLGQQSDFRAGSLDMNGSKDVVELIARTPGAIGYSGMGYATPAVKVLRVARQKGQPGVPPSVATTLDKTYPIARPMYMYTPDTPASHVQAYLDWVQSEAGQRIVEATGYIPLPKQ
jgi:phosphate transport system substrate-binding protein